MGENGSGRDWEMGKEAVTGPGSRAMGENGSGNDWKLGGGKRRVRQG